MDFNEVAKSWDTKDRIERAVKISDEMKKLIVEGNLVGLNQGIEFGCGTGLVGLSLAPLFQHLIMNDAATGMIEVLNDKINQLGYKNVSAVCGDVQVALACQEHFDFIFSSMVIHHIDQVDLLLESFAKRQATGGYVCLVDLDKDFDGHFHSKESSFSGHHGFSHEDIKRYAVNAGYEVLHLYTFYKGLKERDDRNSRYSLFILLAKKC